MKKPPTKDLEGYFALSESWAGSRGEELQRSKRAAWIIASVAVGLAALLAIALIVAMPLKRVETHTLLVDRQTGFVQLLNPLQPETVSADTALTQAYLAQYVIAREEFDLAIIRNDYRKVAMWSAGAARQEYLASMPATNAESPLSRYPRSTVVDVIVKSVTSLGRNRAMVRFDTIERTRGAGVGTAAPKMAVIDFLYSAQPMTVEDRMINPLGFQVTRYRRSMEALPTVTNSPAGERPELTAPGSLGDDGRANVRVQ